MYRRQIGCLIGVVILLAWVSVTLAETVSEEAQRYMARGMAAVEMAKTPKDYERAVREFEQAAKLAPNWPDVYFNLGSVQAKAGNYGEAMRQYKRYLELAPKAPDAAKVREEIYKLEYRAEEQIVKEIKRDGRFIAYNNGTVLDTRTNLIWAAKDNGNGINWKGAKSYCENYRGGDYTDWRMPTLDELAGLYDTAKTYKSACGYDVHSTELIRLTCVAPWASETRGSCAWQFDLNGGGRYCFPPVTGPIYRALPVRSGK
jgi:tetratricopeptide (TPR) repeat protein